VYHRIRYAIEHPPRAFQIFLVRLKRMSATQIVERQALALGGFDLSGDPRERSLVCLVVLIPPDHRGHRSLCTRTGMPKGKGLGTNISTIC
jgi:hypothetical protein